jgi:hypothetical protein
MFERGLVQQSKGGVRFLCGSEVCLDSNVDLLAPELTAVSSPELLERIAAKRRASATNATRRPSR